MASLENSVGRLKHYSYDFILLPDNQVTQEAIRLSQLLAAKLPVRFMLDKKRFIPHFTLYQVELPYKNIIKAVELISELVNIHEPIIVKMGQFVSNNTWVSWNSDVPERLKALHIKVVGRINPLRRSLIVPQLLNDRENLAGVHNQQLSRYGSFGLFDHFRPHITITRLQKTEDSQKALEILGKSSNKKCYLDNLAIGYLGDNGTVKKILKKFPLKGKVHN